MINFIKYIIMALISFFSFSQVAFSKNLSIDKMIFEDIDGQDFKLSNLKGKIILIKENKFKSINRNSIQKLTVREVIKIISNLI